MGQSLSFLGDNNSQLIVPYASDLDFGTGDFTIEWYQYETVSHNHYRPFTRGSYVVGDNIIAVSIELGTFYFWSNFGVGANFAIPSLLNQWVHFAIVRRSGITTIFMNGISQVSFADTVDYTSSLDLIIGDEPDFTDIQTAFVGYMYYFAWNKGYARYTANFNPVPNDFPPVVASTVLMLNVPAAQGSLGSTVIRNNVYDAPYYPPPPPSNRPFYRMIGSMFSNNSVNYKPHSLSASIGSTVRNSRAVARRT